MSDTVDFKPEWPPNWSNAADQVVRSYSAPDSVLVQQDGLLRCMISNASMKFWAALGPLVTSLFLLGCWFGIEDFTERISFMAFGFLCCLVTVGIVYTLMRVHHAKGDYLVVDLVNGNVELPRHGREFGLAEVKCLQILAGRDGDFDAHNYSDLNLFVTEGDDIVRFHLMGNPNKEHAEELSRAMQVPLFDDKVPQGWMRSSERRDTPVEVNKSKAVLASG